MNQYDYLRKQLQKQNKKERFINIIQKHKQISKKAATQFVNNYISNVKFNRKIRTRRRRKRALSRLKQKYALKRRLGIEPEFNGIPIVDLTV